MSKQIDESRPYTKEDIEYVLTLAGGKERVALNAQRFAHLSKKEKSEAQDQASKADSDEAQIQQKLEEAQQQAEEDSYHPDDLAKVEGQTIKEMQQQLRKLGLNDKVTEKDKRDSDDPDDPFTEKEVLAIRLLEHYDAERNAAESPEDSESNKDEDETKSE
ncbi:hypothetical protein PBI_SUZY_13 [Gordonia phage Suzy]|uniref:Uncharacterized protein n=1 Tax=Gordonia phage Suzy TaxID=2201430 RepID=A0A2Z4Q9H8_9CAUD|nr:hypothetical protein HOT44_gp13 [Gordonia phage Suzy]AWY06118.1 hypothetical protein PBI_SUZY_13 [Gordonia phage Suzy]